MTVIGCQPPPYHVPGLLSVLASIRQAADKGSTIAWEINEPEWSSRFASLADAAMLSQRVRQEVREDERR